ncbi:hypothetical protein CWI39_0267p0040 [Hamiltosporidium magnivora]|uniref:Uncharacterized protein n=1 Tax=Hamiltosporidium magnivora TaxID=148818 RepID=A0A4Q9LI29_9MICR|nr:hypothetical protein CWI39_0267p0040 [Hamiltosporidium magnivora]
MTENNDGKQKNINFIDILDFKESEPINEMIVPETTKLKCKKCNEIVLALYADFHCCYIEENETDFIYKNISTKSVNEINLESNSMDFNKRNDIFKETLVEMPSKTVCSNQTNYFTEDANATDNSKPFKIRLKITNKGKRKKKINKKNTENNEKDSTRKPVIIKDSIKKMIINLKPVVKKKWFFPENKYDTFAMKSTVFNSSNLKIPLRTSKRNNQTTNNQQINTKD